jgi:hypothetical protein
VPLIAYVHASGPDEPPRDRRPWEPNWRLWRWLLAAVVVGYAAAHAAGAVQTLLVLVVFGLCCRAVVELLPEGDGLREWRQ